MTAWTIRKRLIRSLIALVAAFWLVGAVIAGLVIRHEIDEVFDGALREATGQIIPIALHEYGLRQSEAMRASADAQSKSLQIGRGHLHFSLRDDRGVVLVASHGAPSEPWAMPHEAGFSNHGAFRHYAHFLSQEGMWIEVTQELKERQEAALGLWLGLVSPLLALLPIAAIAIWRTVGRATEPISRVSGELGTRGGDFLAPIDASGLPGELVPIIDAVNTLLGHLKAALDSERAFAANAAHELRNPIASARAQIQVLAGNLSAGPDQARAENIASQLGQLGRRIERLLQMSRAEAGVGRARERSDLVSVAALLLEDYRRRPDVGDRITLDTADEGSCWVAMDQDAIAIVLRNAIENAVTHGLHTEPIDVLVGRDHTVRVVNGCPAVAPDVLRDLKRRFRRGGLPHAPGTGLGLAIVDTIMRQAGGSVTLRSPAEGRSDGFEIVLAFPGAI